MASPKDTKASVAQLAERANTLRSKEGKVTNYERRRLYSEVCLLEQELGSDSGAYSEELLAIAAKLNFGFRKSPHILSWLLELVDEAVRIIAVWLFLVDSAVLLAIPIIVLNMFVSVQKITVIAKKFVGYTILALSGISLTVQGLETNFFENSIVSLLTFSHSSTMDAFILAAAVPCKHYSLAKAELFAIPFFSWLLSAFGGVAIERSDKEQAFKALRKAATSAQTGDCVAVAPEGTRSKTGQLLPFKKGPFYLWEQLNAPIVPVVVFGAYDLYPPGKQMCLPGKVLVRFLTPIQPSEASSKDGMSKLVRKRMLEALHDCPENVGDGGVFTWQDRIANLVAITAIFSFNSVLAYAIRLLALKHGYTIFDLAKVSGIVSVVITCILYIWKRYLSVLLAPKEEKPGKEHKS